jgi:hypothetical protein
MISRCRSCVASIAIKGRGNGEEQKFGGGVRQDNFKLGCGRGRSRWCCVGVALRANRGGGRRRRRWDCGGEGRQSGAGKAQAEAKTCCPRPDEVGGRQIGGQEEAFNEETCGQEVVHEAEVTISSTLIRCPADYRLALTVAIIGTSPQEGVAPLVRPQELGRRNQSRCGPVTAPLPKEIKKGNKKGDILLFSCLMRMDRGRWLHATHSPSLGRQHLLSRHQSR